jgi:uncharacterized protein (DUF1501 family)
MDRRSFLSKTGIITAGAVLVPSFLKAGVLADNFKLNNKRLIVIQLSGGNDGLNMLTPYGFDEYYQNRPVLGLPQKDLLKVNDLFGFHSKLTVFRDLQNRGLLSIVNSVGYPNPNRSHFRSMDIWHTASDSNKFSTTGWLGSYLDTNCTNPFEAINIDGQLSLALKGKVHSGIALTDPSAFKSSIDSDFYRNLKDPITENVELDYMYKIFNDTKNSAEYIYDQYKLKENLTEYGKSGFEQKLKKIATLIKSDIQTPVFYTTLGGFDTHVNQLGTHDRLYSQLNDGLETLISDLEKDDVLKDTTIMVFSEFGRRLKENASRGTDHGAANVMYVIDSDLSPNAQTLNNLDLTNLEKGDPKFKVDFRSVYQDIITHTLKADPKQILGNSFENLNLFNP